MRRFLIGCLLGASCLPVPAFAAESSATPQRVVVTAAPAQASTVAAGLGRAALRVVRRYGDRFEVLAPAARRPALRALSGVVGVAPAAAVFGDEVTGEGVVRTGAVGLLERTGGRGVTIAVLDLGFGGSMAARQARGELPPPERLELVSFDPVHGIAGRNAYGNPTNHGELVAQSVYDYAPEASYIFVNYQSVGDFLAATRWLGARRPDIVVHSNSFIEGPFDGSGPEAQAVNAAAAAGILWFNSAGNYALNHISTPWADLNGDGTLDLVNGGTFSRLARQPITFAVSWRHPAGGVADLDIVLERLSPDGQWAPVATSRDAQAAGAPPAERVLGHVPQSAGAYRLRVERVSGPPPSGPITIFSREVSARDLGGTPVASIPTPGDAEGSITVGAVDWRGDLYKSYSSQGPTLDGRLKPDVVAPTNTRVLGPSGPRAVGGTSTAAPNAAGVAALLLSRRRAAGADTSVATMKGLLLAIARDLGEVGPDPVFGFGRVRAETSAPRVRVPLSRRKPIRGTLRLKPSITDASPIARWAVFVDGAALTDRRPPVGSVLLRTRRLADGPHVLEFVASDLPGNERRLTRRVVVDNRRPQLGLRRVQIVRPKARRVAAAPPPGGRPKRLPVRVVVLARDRAPFPMTVEARVLSGRRTVARKVHRTRSTTARRITLGRIPAGRYRLLVTLTDAAGNRTKKSRRLVVR